MPFPGLSLGETRCWHGGLSTGVLSLLLIACGGGTDRPNPAPSTGNLPSSGSGNTSGGSDTPSSEPAPGPLTNIRLDNPREIEADANGNLYVVDGPYEAARIRQIAPDGSITTLLENGSRIAELAVTPAGDIFYSTIELSQDDPSAREDTVWSLSDGIPTELASNDVGIIQAMTVEPGTNNVYISSTFATIKRITPDGIVTTLFSFEQR